MIDFRAAMLLRSGREGGEIRNAEWRGSVDDCDADNRL